MSGLPPTRIGTALISTPLSISNASRPGSTNAGTVVVNSVDVRGSLGARSPATGGSAPSGGYVIGFLESPFYRRRPAHRLRRRCLWLLALLNTVYGTSNGASSGGTMKRVTR